MKKEKKKDTSNMELNESTSRDGVIQPLRKTKAIPMTGSRK